MVNTERHLRWNWEETPVKDSGNSANADGNRYVRYHFVVVDDRDREGLLNRLVASLAMYGELVPVRTCEGKVRGTRFRYLFQSYDSAIRPDMLDFKNLPKGRLIKRDSDLRERVKGNIEDYVARVYE